MTQDDLCTESSPQVGGDKEGVVKNAITQFITQIARIFLVNDIELEGG